MKYAAYEKYMDSPLEWSGSIPAHWQIKKIGHLVLLKSGENIVSEEIAEGGKYPVFGGNGFRGYFNQYTHEGSFVLIGRQGALCGNINYASGKFWASEHALVAHPLADFDLRWFGETLRAMNLNQYSVSSAQPGLAASAISALRLPFPPINEQQTIARFLDTKTAQIDELIAKKRQLIAKLKEKRQALIARTVTRGLPPEAAKAAGLESNPNPEMKDSGVDFLGVVPKTWNVVRLKHVLNAKKGAIKTGPFGSQLHGSEMLESEIKVFNQRTVIDRDISSGDNYISLEKFEELKSFEVFPGDLLVTTRGTIGRCMVVPDGAEKGILHPCLMRLQLNKIHITDRYLELLIEESGYVIDQLRLMSNATTIEVIYSESLKEVWLAVPPLNEQCKIIEYLDRGASKLDALVERTVLAIARLTEYRQALITSAVTGKIDVRATA